MRDPIKVTLCVDALEPQLGGIGRYVWELATRLPREPAVSSVSFYRAGQLVDPHRLVRGDPLKRGSLAARKLEKWRTERLLRSTVVHAPNYFLPSAAETGIMTVHDLSVFRFPETHPAARVSHFEHHFEDSLARAVHIITDTETVRAELAESFGVAPERVTAVPLGVSAQFRPRPEPELVRHLDQFGLAPGRYGLSVSTIEPRKKILELIRAWRSLPRTLRDAFPLVLVGGAGWENGPLHAEIDSASSEGWLRHLGYVAEADLPFLYAGAALFGYLSSYEGFGLPPVEAMASGVPVVVARLSCLPEICGNAAQYVDPDDHEQIVATIKQCLEDSHLREQCARRGLEQAGRYTWERCIQDTVAVYRQAKRG